MPLEVSFRDVYAIATDTLLGDPIDISQSRAELFESRDLPDHGSNHDADVNEELSTLRDKVKEFKKRP